MIWGFISSTIMFNSVFLFIMFLAFKHTHLIFQIMMCSSICIFWDILSLCLPIVFFDKPLCPTSLTIVLYPSHWQPPLTVHRQKLQPLSTKILTRFNKIAIQGTPQMAIDKEAIICLSRVYSYYFKCNFPKCNFPLFYVYPALTRYLSILFLNTLTRLACTHSSGNLFHTLMVLCEHEIFLTSNLLCFFTRAKYCCAL